MMFVTGIGFGFTYALPFAIVPDAIEYDYLQTGERREGAFYSIWTWGFKIGQALAIFVMGWVLNFSGYVENAVQSPSAQFGIRLFLGPIPAIILAAGALVLYFYPINEERYGEILRQIREKEGAAQTT
jgi:glycoside/pentoside/hexuronide:cation symporter, GPH family